MDEKVTLYHRLGVDLVGVGRFGRNDPVELPAELAEQWLAGQAANWSKEPWPDPPGLEDPEAGRGQGREAQPPAPETDARPRVRRARKEDDRAES